MPPKHNKPKRCKECNRIVATWNKSGLCSNCYQIWRYKKHLGCYKEEKVGA